MTAYQVDELRSLLGAESEGVWIDFMQKVDEFAPFLFQPGRPTAQQIEASFIGQAGFKSWSDLINHLGWNESGWRAWSRAYKIVKNHDYLKDVRPTASAINTTWNQSKPDFPADIDAWNQHRDRMEREQKEKQARSLADAKNQVIECEGRVDTLKLEISAKNGQISTLNAQIAGLKAELATSNEKITEIDGKNSQLQQSLKSSESKNSALISKINDHNRKPWYSRASKIR